MFYQEVAKQPEFLWRLTGTRPEIILAQFLAVGFLLPPDRNEKLMGRGADYKARIL